MSELVLQDQESYEAAVLQYMQSLYDNKEFCDIVLIAEIDKQRYSCHRLVLACASQFFDIMFTSPMRESQLSEIVLNEVSGEQLKPLIDFCYTGEMDVHEDADGSADSAKKLLATASLLQLDDAVYACGCYLQEHLTPANCVGIYGLAEQHSLTELQRQVEAYIIENFEDVCVHEEFLQIPFEHLALLIANDKLNMPTEEMIFSNVMFWVQHDAQSRKQHIPELLKLVRLVLLSPQFLNNEVRDLCTKHGCEQLFTDVLAWQSAPAAPTELSLQQTKLRSGEKNSDLLAVYYNDGRIFIDIYCPVKEEWLSYARFRHIMLYEAIILKKSLMIVGNDFESVSSTVLRFDLIERSFKRLRQLMVMRFGFKLAVLNDILYAVGGQGNHNSEALKSVERYDPVANKWVIVASMTTGRINPGVATFNGLIYACGGTEDYITHNSTESYNPVTDQWTQRANMTSMRSGHGIAVAHGFLYAVAGIVNNTSMSTVERYDPRTDKWIQICALEYSEGYMRSVLFGERLLSFSDRCCRRPIEEYNFETNRFTYWKINIESNKLQLNLLSVRNMRLKKLVESRKVSIITNLSWLT